MAGLLYLTGMGVQPHLVLLQSWLLPLVYGSLLYLKGMSLSTSSSLTLVMTIVVWITSIFDGHESTGSSSLTLAMTIGIWITSIFDGHESTGSSSPTLVVAIAI